MSDCSAAAAENFDVVRAFFAHKIHNTCKELDVPAVVTRNTNGADILLDGGTHNIAD